MNYQLGHARSPWLFGSLLAFVTILLGSLDLASHEHHRGIVVALVAVPASSLVVPGDRPSRWTLYAGGLALGGAPVGSAVDWHNGRSLRAVRRRRVPGRTPSAASAWPCIPCPGRTGPLWRPTCATRGRLRTVRASSSPI
ncbi:hypothetical protein GCM10010277_83290 [Streptomyces longisporoflavus]|nr:hypothetical protein GCM10010277_83290 [Streptomyces longisporoflavus]